MQNDDVLLDLGCLLAPKMIPLPSSSFKITKIHTHDKKCPQKKLGLARAELGDGGWCKEQRWGYKGV